MAKTINHAKALNLRMYPGDLIRFLKKIRRNKKTGCWTWKAHKDLLGYGQFWFRGRVYWAHRLSFATFCRKIPARKQVDHLCKNPSCVNPDHLCLADHAANAGRKSAPYSYYLKGLCGLDQAPRKRPIQAEAPF
jgi:hypothetical protein